MKFAILGAGGIGGYYGGVLARAGHDVQVLARGINLSVLRDKGLEVRTPDQAFVGKVRAVENPQEFVPVDCAIVAVKAYSLSEIAPAARHLAQQGALILPLLNGVDIAERLVELGVPQNRVVGGLTTISAVRIAPGVFERRSGFQKIIVGELFDSTGGNDPERTVQLKQIVKAFQDAGVEALVSSDIRADLWRKFAFIATMAAACGLSRAPVGAVRAAPLGPLLLERAIREVVTVARAKNINLADDEVARILAFCNSLPPAMKPSLLIDLEAGRPTEIDELCGAVGRIGRSVGVETPIHDTALAALSAKRQ